jgi:hypothetical protein
MLILTLLTGLLITRSDFELSILRTPGIMFQEQPDNKISNLYDLKIVNKTFETLPAKLELQNIEGEIKIIGSDLIVDPQGVEEAKFLVILDKNQIEVMNTPIEIAVTSNDMVIDVIKTSFLGRVNKKDVKK